MKNSDGTRFVEWVDAQMRARRMSQRQLAQRTGVDHSTIGRLIRAESHPTLATATRIVKALQDPRESPGTTGSLDVFARQPIDAPGRVRAALRADVMLSEDQVRLLSEYHATVRSGRLGPRDPAHRRVPTSGAREAVGR
jgi:transcriptional regulator with XRE-family HTH domain